MVDLSMVNTYRPHEFGSLIGRSVPTLQRWDRNKILIAHRHPSGRRYYTHDQYLQYIGVKASSESKTIVYMRVSSANQRNDLQSQRKALESFCTAQGIAVDEWIEDVGSGLNYKRKGFNKILGDCETGSVGKIIIAHKDRLVRFGFEWFEAFCTKHGTKLIIMNQESLSPQEEMVKDLMTIVHVFSSRLYGLRRYKDKIKEAVETPC